MTMMRTRTYQAALLLLAAMAAADTTTNGGLPNLSTATIPDVSSSTSSASSTAASSTSASSASASTTSASSVSTTASGTSTFTGLTGVPSIYGAGVPTMIVPDTSRAPFMQHSTLPEGTVFIAVGAVLAFLGVCVLLWRALVAWSINRSVKRAAMASIRGGSEKPSTNWGGSSTGFNPAKGSMYKDIGSSMSMEALTSTGKPIKSHFKDHDVGRSTPPPPSNLFFSPTAQARTDASRNTMDASRNSSYLPAGYYAAPNSHAAGGQRNTVIGGQLPPFARASMVEPSPPASPSLRPSTSHYAGSDHLRPSASRDGGRQSLYAQPSSSSLMVGVNNRASSEGLGGSRAPSAFLDDLFENHTAMASRDHI